MKIQFALLMVVSILLNACAQVEVITPNPRVEPPETRGEAFRWKVGGSAASAHRYKATEDAGRRPPNMDDATTSGHYDFHPTGYFSLAPRMDLGVELNILGRGASLMGKIQLWGDGTLDAKKGNVPIALFARTGQVNGENSGDQSETFGAGGYPWKGQVTTNFAQVGISGGYRTTDHLLVYGGVAGGKYWSDIKITQDPANNGSDPGGTYTKDATGDALTASAGVMFSWRKFQVYVAGEAVRFDYNDTKADDQYSVHTGAFFTP